jgi:hypothetical protein
MFSAQPVSLYLRSGLCFECQRNLNEKRRMDRKRPKNHETAPNEEGEAVTERSGPNLIYALAPSNKKFRLNGSTIQLKSDAIIINGAVQGTKPFGEEYGFQEIGHDLHHCAQEAAQATESLLNAVACHGHVASSASAVQSMDCHSSDDTTAAAVGGGDVSAMFDRAFLAMNRSIFLLSQWKASWDVAIAAANETVSDPSFASVVESAAAFAAGEIDQSPTPAAPSAIANAPRGNGSADLHASDGHHMVSLLLAADQDKQEGKGDLVIGEHDADSTAGIHDAAVDASAIHDDADVDDMVSAMVAAAEGEEDYAVRYHHDGLPQNHHAEDEKVVGL